MLFTELVVIILCTIIIILFIYVSPEGEELTAIDIVSLCLTCVLYIIDTVAMIALYIYICKVFSYTKMDLTKTLLFIGFNIVMLILFFHIIVKVIVQSILILTDDDSPLEILIEDSVLNEV